MARTYKKDDSIITLDDLFSIGLPKHSELDDIHRAINDRVTFGCQVIASSPADSIVNIGSAEVQLADGRVQRITGTFDFTGATIDVVSGVTTGGPIEAFIFPTATAGQYVRMGFSLGASGILEVVFNEPSGSLGGDGNLNLGAFPLGFVDLESLGGTSYKGEAAASNIVENEHITQFLASGGGGQDPLKKGVAITPANGFLAAVEDCLDIHPSDADSFLAPETTALYQRIDPDHDDNGNFKLLCDKSVSITTAGTGFSLASAPSYTIQEGDVVYSDGDFRRVVSLIDQQNGTLDAAFISNLAAASGMVSQAVWTDNLINAGDAAENIRFLDLFGIYDHLSAHVDITDSYVPGDIVPNVAEDGAISYAVSNDGLSIDVGLPLADTYGSVRERAVFSDQAENYSLLNNTNTERIFIVFFASPINVNVTTTANLLGYKLSAYEDGGVSNGGFLNTAYCLLNGLGTPLNCLPPTVVFDAVEAANVTEIELEWDYIQGAAPGEADGEIEVIIEGIDLPRKFTGVSGDWWKPVPGSTRRIRLSQDFSGLSGNVHVRRRQGSFDNSPENSVKISATNGAIVGNADDVTNQIADFSSIQTAINTVPIGTKITLLNRTFTENVTWNKKVFMMGQGNDSVINGTVNFSGAADRSATQFLKFAGNVTVANGVKGLILSNGWLSSGTVLTDNNPSSTDSLYLLIEEV